MLIDYGYCKDKRNDLKQIMFGLGSVKDAAKQLAEHLTLRTKYHRISGQVERVGQVKRPRGRPAKEAAYPVEVVYVYATLLIVFDFVVRQRFSLCTAFAEHQI